MNKATGIQLLSNAHLAITPVRKGGFITSGLMVGNTLYQNQFVLLKAQKGELKENPMMGVGIEDMEGDNDMVAWKKSIRDEFTKDGLKVNTLTIDMTGNTNLKADYI